MEKYHIAIPARRVSTASIIVQLYRRVMMQNFNDELQKITNIVHAIL